MRRVARQRLEHLIFVQAAVEALPAELSGTADAISVNFPWGSLLRALAVPAHELLTAIAGLGRPGATLTALVNMSVFDDAAYCRRLGLPSPPVLADRSAAATAFASAGLTLTGLTPAIAELPYATTWGQKLTKGGRRQILRLDAVVDAAASRQQV